MEKAKEFQKNIYFCFIDYDKAFDCVDHDKLWKIPKHLELSTIILNNPLVWKEVKIYFELYKKHY